AEAERHARDGAHVVDDQLPAVDGRNVGPARRLDGLDRAAAAGAFDEADHGQPQLVRHQLAHVVLALDGRVGRAAAHGEVVAADHDGAPLDLRPPEDEIGRRELLEVVALVIGCPAGDLAELVEGARVDQPGDSLADGVASTVVLALDALGSAEPLGELLAPPQLVQLLLPIHAASIRRSRVRYRVYSIRACRAPLAAVSSIAHVKQPIRVLELLVTTSPGGGPKH